MIPRTAGAAPAGHALPGAALARFAEARGHRVAEALGVLWEEQQPHRFVALPNERRLDPDPRELAAAMRKARMPALRYFTDAPSGWPCGVFVLSPADYSLARVNPTHRKQVRRGLDATECRALDPDELLALGLELNLDAMARQGRFDPEFGEPARWKRFVAAIRKCPEASVLGAFREGRLSSYHVNCRDGEWLHLLYKMNRTEDMGRYASVALDFWELARAAEDPSLRGVECGHASIVDGFEQLHRYKIAMGFELAPARLAIRFHPALQPLATNRLTTGIADALWKLSPRRRGLETAAKMLRCARLSATEGAAGAEAAPRERG